MVDNRLPRGRAGPALGTAGRSNCTLPRSPNRPAMPCQVIWIKPRAAAISAVSAGQRQALVFVNVTVKYWDGFSAGPACHPWAEGYAAIASNVAKRRSAFARSHPQCRFWLKIALAVENLHPPITTKASMVRDARTSMVSKEASFMMPSASYPAATVVDSII
jgi:hypothetical protein